MGNSTGNTNKKIRKWAKIIKQRKDVGICRNKQEKAIQEKITIQHAEINQKVRAKERRLKRYRLRVNNTDKVGHSKTMNENSINNWEEMTLKHTNYQMQKKYELKYGNQKNRKAK